MRAIIWHPSGEKTERVLDRQLTLEEMQIIVGGYIELVPIPEELSRTGIKTILADEEGLLKPEPQLNITATLLCNRKLVGTVLMLDYEMD